MNKWTVTIASTAAAALIFSGAGYAAAKGKDENHKSAQGSEKASKENQKIAKENKGNNGSGKEIKIKLEQQAEATVTGDVYGKGKGKLHGLQRAYENVKDKPAGRVIADLIQKRGGTVEGLTAAELSTAAEGLELEGELEAAVDVQKEAIKADKRNLELYKKLGKLEKKFGKEAVKAFVNGVEPNFEVAPFIKDGSTLVPFRAIAEALNAEVTWNPEERSVTVVKDGVEIKLVIGSVTAYVNGVETTLEVPAAVEEGSTVVPVRFISESLDAEVQWESESQSVIITDETVVTEDAAVEETVPAENAETAASTDAAEQTDEAAADAAAEQAADETTQN